MAVVDGKELKGAEADRLVKKLYEGALQHPTAAPLWREWHIEYRGPGVGRVRDENGAPRVRRAAV